MFMTPDATGHLARLNGQKALHPLDRHVVFIKRGKEVFYSIQAGAVVESLRAVADAIEQCCPEEKDNDK